MIGKKVNLLNYILIIVLFLYFFMSNLSNHNIYCDIMIIAFSFFSIILMLFKKKVYINKYFIFYLLFVLYQVLLIVLGRAYNTSITIKVLTTLIINFSILIMIYNFIINNNNIERILKVYIYSSSLSLLTIMFILRNTLFTSRLAHAYGEGSISFYFLGKATVLSSNSIAFYCAVSALICLYFLTKYKQKKYLFLALFLMFGSILTGSRKGILLLIIYLLYFVHYHFKGNYLKRILIVMGVCLTIYLVLTKVPAFYNILGYRLMELVNKILGNTSHEGSIVAREAYKRFALEMIPRNLFLGYGAGYFSYVYGNVTEINYLEILVAGGIVGLFIYYFNYILILKNYLLSRKHVSNITKVLFVVFISLFINDIGAVTYTARNILTALVLFLGSMKIDDERYKNEIKKKQKNN